MKPQSRQMPSAPSTMCRPFLNYLSEMLAKHSTKGEKHAGFAVLCMAFIVLFGSLLVGVSLVLLALYDAAHLFAGDKVQRFKRHIRRDQEDRGD